MRASGDDGGKRRGAPSSEPEARVAAFAWYAPGWVDSLSDPLEVARALLPVFDASSPPTISIHGDADPVVPYSQSVRLQEALTQAHVAGQLVTIPGGKHGGFTRAENERAFAAIEAFFEKPGPVACELGTLPLGESRAAEVSSVANIE